MVRVSRSRRTLCVTETGILHQNIDKGDNEGTRKKIFCLTCRRKIIPRKMFRLAHLVAYDPPCELHILPMSRPICFPYSFFLPIWNDYLFEPLISSKPPSIGHTPRIEPLEVGPLGVASFHAEGDGSEHPEQSNDNSVENSVDSILQSTRETACDPVGAESKAEDSKVESRVVVVDVSDTTHGHERCVMQNPTNDGVDTGVVDLVNVLLG